MSAFEKLGLAPAILKALRKQNYDQPTPIQEQGIPALLEGRDLCGIAQTGTGKTAAFCLPSLHRLDEKMAATPPHSCRMLVLTPTRELAAQIETSCRAYGRFLDLSVASVFGGVPINRQIRELQKGVDILIATPGRLLDLISQRAFHLRGVEILVLDEADRMMDMGFIRPVQTIAGMVSKDRQTIFFSATMPREIEALAGQFLSNPVKVAVAPQSTTAERIAQSVIFVDQKQKQPLLHRLLKDEEYDRILVFTRTKYGADRVVRFLNAANFPAAAIHGDKSQGQRTAALQAFRDGKARLLVATDIAARGIDIPGVSHVVNFELPNVPEQYVHRIGRTARAGAEGVAISLVADDERAYLRAIEKATGVKCEVRPLPENFAEDIRNLPKPPPKPRNPGRSGGRPAKGADGQGKKDGGGGAGRRSGPKGSAKASVGRHRDAVRPAGRRGGPGNKGGGKGG